MKTMGMIDVASFAARLGCGANATMRPGLRTTSCRASPGSRSSWPPAALVFVARVLLLDPAQIAQRRAKCVVRRTFALGRAQDARSG